MFEGTYDTDFGEVRLHQEGTAVFGDYALVGRIDAQFDPDTETAEGTFTNGSRQGRLAFTLTADGFAGRWAWGDARPRSRWNGEKVNWAQPELTRYSGDDATGSSASRALLVVSSLEVRSSRWLRLYEWLDKQGIKQALNRLGGHYDHIETLSGKAASWSSILDELRGFGRNTAIREIDFILHCHGGSSSGFMFADTSINAEEFAKDVGALGLSDRLRMFYTTACWGSRYINGVVEAGFNCASGAKEINANSPAEFPEFLKRWRKGEAFKDCVEKAFNPVRSKALDKGASVFMTGKVDSEKVLAGDTSARITTGKN